MARRPIAEKRAKRLRKAMRKQLPEFMDVVWWVRSHGHADTGGKARDLILAGRLKSESHTVGIKTEKRLDATGKVVDEKVVDRYVPLERCRALRVEAA